MNQIINHKGKHYLKTETGYREVLATTDKSLGIIIGDKLIDPETNTKEIIGDILPQPSQAFIEKYVEQYNKGNQIVDVLVEYEEYAVGNYGMSNGEPTIDERLKINSKDNTITIKKVKDSWSKKEIKSKLWEIRTFYEKTKDLPYKHIRPLFDEWIEENL